MTPVKVEMSHVFIVILLNDETYSSHLQLTCKINAVNYHNLIVFFFFNTHITAKKIGILFHVFFFSLHQWEIIFS